MFKIYGMGSKVKKSNSCYWPQQLDVSCRLDGFEEDYTVLGAYFFEHKRKYGSFHDFFRLKSTEEKLKNGYHNDTSSSAKLFGILAGANAAFGRNQQCSDAFLLLLQHIAGPEAINKFSHYVVCLITYIIFVAQSTTTLQQQLQQSPANSMGCAAASSTDPALAFQSAMQQQNRPFALFGSDRGGIQHQNFRPNSPIGAG
jgi:hypothetical protein